MKILLVYNKQGEIVSVSKVSALPEDLSQGNNLIFLDEDEFLMEFTPEGEFLELNTIQIHEQYKVDVNSKRLMKK